ncbi:MAG TPA: hypothetical protein VMG08_01230 [Allosphingosinicella sp.]|nr:hypothetical protein [Allosphingosinicella sp.]
MATSTIDGTVEEAVIKRRRSQGSFYERIKFRLDDGSTRTWAKAHVMNDVSDLLAPGTRGRFYLFTAIDHRGVSGIRTEDGREAFGVSKLNENVGLAIAVINLILTIFYVAVMDKVSILALILMILGVPMFFLYRQNRLDAEKAFRREAGFRPAARAA